MFFLELRNHKGKQANTLISLKQFMPWKLKITIYFIKWFWFHLSTCIHKYEIYEPLNLINSRKFTMSSCSYVHLNCWITFIYGRMNFHFRKSMNYMYMLISFLHFLPPTQTRKERVRLVVGENKTMMKTTSICGS